MTSPRTARPLLILKTGATHAHIRERLGDFDDWIASGLSAGGATAMAHDARTGVPPAPDTFSGVVITGSHAMVSDREPWSEALVPWLQTAVALGVPTLGICYGHQLLAHALGGTVAHHPDGVEIGTVTVTRTPQAVHDPLLGALPTRFAAQAVHWQSVRALPAGATLLASSAHESHHAFRIGERAWGVQFHPEFSDAALRLYLEGLQPTLAREGLDAAAIADALKPTPEAASVLPRFAQLALQPA
ncbi:glutamine amidotransferase [Hydrogenophaga electricum]|uniref:GMP synthase n=1 Tax=Hydrogenophaga electricum TaxID=1230953 RepID=A0ABQ6C8U8_9BURK|nr:glutamine amidotransferase [Hydrogenophaga electricum]GLS16410.1 GMP synthase [Hydrogenophaga electricum]